MIIHCPQCPARYQYAEERLGDQDTRKVRCVRCSAVFEVNKPSAAAAPEPETAAPAEPESQPVADAAAFEGGTTSEDLMEITLRKKEQALAEDPPDEPPPPPRKRRRTSPGIARIDIQPSGDDDGVPKLPAGYRLSLAIINGPDAGKVYRIETPRIVIGRSGADLELTDDEISRSHAAIEVRDALILLEDLKSTNGTIHKGKVLEVPTPLHNHSEFKIGNTTLMLIVTREG